MSFVRLGRFLNGGVIQTTGMQAAGSIAIASALQQHLVALAALPDASTWTPSTLTSTSALASASAGSAAGVSSELIWLVGIEQYLKTYGSGQWHTKGLFALAELNALVRWIAGSTFHCTPLLIHPRAPRALYDLKPPVHTEALVKTPDANTPVDLGAKAKRPAPSASIKRTVLDFVKQRMPAGVTLPSNIWPERPSKRSRESKALLDLACDQADSHLLALATLHAHRKQLIMIDRAEWARFAQALDQLAADTSKAGVKTRQQIAALSDLQLMTMFEAAVETLPPP